MTWFVMIGEDNGMSMEVALAINALAFSMAMEPMDKKALAVVAIDDRSM